MKAELKTLNSQVNDAEERTSDLEDRIIEITKSKEQTENQMKKKKKGRNIRDLWDNIKCGNLCIIGTPEKEENDKGE